LIGGDAEVGIGASEPVAAASVFKINVALELFRQGESGSIDVTEQAELLPGRRTRGPTGISHFHDPVSASLRDLAYLMMTISDNAATDEIMRRVTIDRLNATSDELGLVGTHIDCDLRSLLDSAGVDHGFRNWRELMDAVAGYRGDEDRRRALDPDLILTRRGITPSTTNRTTPQDMTRLLELIWMNQAGPAPACEQVRWMMGQQVSQNKLATGFPSEVVTSAKSGSLFGVVRNEVGVVQLPNGASYAVAVFTRAHEPFVQQRAINDAIGTVAAELVASLAVTPAA